MTEFCQLVAVLVSFHVSIDIFLILVCVAKWYLLSFLSHIEFKVTCQIIAYDRIQISKVCENCIWSIWLCGRFSQVMARWLIMQFVELSWWKVSSCDVKKILQNVSIPCLFFSKHSFGFDGMTLPQSNASLIDWIIFFFLGLIWSDIIRNGMCFWICFYFCS